MKDEQLTSLGKTLQRDFQALFDSYSTGWFEQDNLVWENLQQLDAIAAEVQQLFQVSYEFAALEQSLTSGFVSADLGEHSSNADEVASEAGAAVSPRLSPANSNQASHIHGLGIRGWGMESQPLLGDTNNNSSIEESSLVSEERYPNLHQSFPSDRSIAKGSKPLTDSASAAESHLRSPLESHHPIKGLKDFAQRLESEQGGGKASLFEGVYSQQNAEASVEGTALNSLSKPNLPNSPTPSSSGGGSSDEREAVLGRVSPSKALWEEQLFSKPLLEEQEEMMLSPLREDSNLREGESIKRSNLLGFQTLEGVSHISHPASADALFSTAFLEAQETEDMIPSPPPNDSNSGAGKHASHLQALGLQMLQETAFSQPSMMEQNIPSREGALSNNPSPDTFLAKQEHPSEAELRLEEAPESVKQGSDRSEVDLDVIMEAIAREIQQEYKRFYGS